MITLVLLPGMDGTGELFAPFIETLGDAFAVKVVRYPTDQPLDHAELEQAVRSALPDHGEFILVGESFSGPIAISLAASAPRGLIGLVLCCTFARNPRPLFSGLRRFVAMAPVRMAPTGLLSSLLLGKFSTPALREALARSLAQVAEPVLRARLASVLSVDVTDKLPAVRVPMLYLRASRDRVVPASASAWIAQAAPGVRIVELDAPHFLLQAAPAQAARTIRDFAQAL